jgi:hypothetical protein
LVLGDKLGAPVAFDELAEAHFRRFTRYSVVEGCSHIKRPEWSADVGMAFDEETN